jgi:hypothetical protein
MILVYGRPMVARGVARGIGRIVVAGALVLSIGKLGRGVEDDYLQTVVKGVDDYVGSGRRWAGGSVRFGAAWSLQGGRRGGSAGGVGRSAG